MRLNVNGTDYDVDEAPDRLLLWVLRDELGLTGTKFGCGIGQCGSCTILLDDRLVKSCVTQISAVRGRPIRTIEGLATTAADGSEALHPVQQAFVDEQVHQCGWCMSAQVLTAVALLERTPDPSEEEVRRGMSSVLCRCGTYHRIRKAVHRAADEMAKREGGQA